MKRFIQKQLLLLVAVLSATITATAYDFEVNGIYYGITSDVDKTCSVTYRYKNGNDYSGSINIPSTVDYNNTSYTVTGIGYQAFYNCSGLTSVTIPNSVTSIRESAFEDCSSLTSVTIPNSVTSIGVSVFESCSSLTSVTIPNSVTTISYRAFYNCSSLASVVIPNSVTTISNSAFYNCSSLASVVIPNSVTSIGSSAFYNCTNIHSLSIGAGVISINDDAFSYEYGKISIRKVIWLPNTRPSGYFEVSGNQNYVANDSYSGLYNVTVYPFLSSMFEEGGIKYVPVSPSDRTCDAIDCVYDNSASDIVITKTVNHQGISMSLRNVNDYLCYDNDSIRTVTIKDFDANIGRYAFYDCDCIETVNVQGLTGNIGYDAFYDCDCIETVNLHDMEGSIGESAFYYCRNLKGIDIPNTVTSIGEGCFQYCHSLAYANIGSGILSLPYSCFSGTGLTEIRIPQTVANIGDNVFGGCSSLANVYIEDRKTELVLGSNDSDPMFSDCPLDSVYIGGNISYETGSNSGYSPFYRNTSLRAVKITDQETEISTNEFYGCSNLQRVELGDGIESIGDYAFSGCSAIESFTFGNSLQTIGQEAFSDCTAMTQLISRTEVPPVCGTQALDDINKWNCTLLVPDSSIDAYRAADQWKEFFFIESSSVGNIVADECAVWVENGKLMFSGFPTDTQVNIYNIAGQLVHSGEMESCPDMPTGLYIVAINGLTYKILVK